jgi:hypothetical protein
MSVHVVKAGECLSSIAGRHGLTWRQLWDDPGNAALRARRKDPHILHPGDAVTIPAPGPPRVPLTPGTITTVVRRRRGCRPLTLRLADARDVPLADADYVLTPRGAPERRGRTDGHGVLREELPCEVEEARLEVGEWVYELAVGHLNPLEDTDDDGVTGAQARLANLGYDTGDVDGKLGPVTAAALREFQEDHGLEVTGALDAPTRERLRARHGR